MEELYKNVYKEISDLENLPIPDNSNEIDMDGLKEIISSREEYKKTKELCPNCYKYSVNFSYISSIIMCKVHFNYLYIFWYNCYNYI